MSDCYFTVQRKDELVRVLIDPDMLAWAIRFNWQINYKNYVLRNMRLPDGTTFKSRLHREIMGLRHGDGLQVDHINRDPLDNRRCNLRVVTPSENSQNVAAHRDGSSPHRGVSYHRSRNVWRAAHMLRGEHWQRTFATEAEAVAAVQQRRREVLGEAFSG